MSSTPILWSERPRLRDPVLVAAFTGWNDAGEAATAAREWLAERAGGRVVARVDDSRHADRQVQRPEIELVDGAIRRVESSTTEVLAASVPASDHDVVLLRAREPNFGWPSYIDAVVETATQLGCAGAVTLGALLVDAPHTRDAPLAGAGGPGAFAARLGLEPSRYEGPTGITGVLTAALTRSGISTVSMWAPVPHYAPSPNVPATLALVERTVQVLGWTPDLATLHRQAQAWRRGVDRLVAEDASLTEYVRELERRFDAAQADRDHAAAEEPELPDLPGGDDIAADVERYLRNREEGDDPPVEE